MSANDNVIFIMGPTASGKTEIAVRLADAFPVDIISVDSAMVYSGMDIGTAKPDAATLAVAPHRLIDICDPAESYSAAQFRLDAQKEIQKTLDNGRIPLLVGGTFLYFKALQKGLSPLPSADPLIRAELAEQAEQIGWEGMHKKLMEIDADAGHRIHPNDPQRIQRALEVFRISGKTMTELCATQPAQPFAYNVHRIVLATQNREVLHQRIKQRFKIMLNQGLIEEVEALYTRDDLNSDLPSIRAVGYRQVWEYLSGQTNKETMEERAIVATRQFAKRQYTWLRSECPEIWFDALSPNIYNEVLKKLAMSSIL